MESAIKEIQDGLKNKKLLQDVRRQLKPLFFDFYPSSKQYRLYMKHIEQIGEKAQRAASSVRALSSVIHVFEDASVQKTSKEKALNSALETKKGLVLIIAYSYLLSIETIGTLFVNMTVLLLIGKGHDFHIEPDYHRRFTRHAKSLEDLESPAVTLASKMGFLESHGFTMFSKWIDRGLRNAIAHLNFEVDEEGKFYTLSRKGKKEVDLFQKLAIFDEYFSAHLIVLLENQPKIMAEKDPAKGE